MSQTQAFDAVLFDCDGVLVDSEPITNGVLCQMLNESGWALSPQDCMRLFVGKAVRDERALIEAQTAKPLTEDWMHTFYQRRNLRLQAELQVVPGALELVMAAHRMAQGRIACASGADRHKVEFQIDKVGMRPYFEQRIFSGHECARSKPYPDVYLQAAQSVATDPARCLVVEDTPTGVTAGVAAGATVWAYCPVAQAAPALLTAGAQAVFASMQALTQALA